MAQLVFHVQADYEEVIRLRNEIEKLKKELKGMDATVSPAAFNTLNTQLSASTKRMDELVTEAAKAGAEMEQGFKRKIFDASQTVNGFTEKIIAQKAVVKDVEADVKRLGEAYRTALKNNRYGGYGGGANNALAEYNAARRALDEEKAALFALTQEQATARLSVKKLRDEYALYRDDSKETVVATEGIGISLKKAFAMIGGAALGKQLISDMIRVRGEFQAADTAIQTLLGSKEKADALMSKVREYAKISPLEFSDVTQATQMMLGFNIEAEKVPRFLQAIGDVSMGETQKFNSLTLAFSQMSAAGKLMGQDLNQMINAGFNPLQTMSEKTGKSIAQLKEEMSKGAISAEMVQQAFIDATSAGGKFYQMSENASKTINGQLSMMQDAMDAAFNEMGQKSEGFIISGIQMTTKLIENYETVGKVLAGLVITYGTYKAALIANIALTHSWAVAARADAVAKGIQTAATKAATVAQLALNAAMKANPYVLLITTVAALGTAMWALRDSTSAAEKAETSLNNTMTALGESQEKYNNQTKEAINIATDDASATKDRKDAMDLLINRYPSIIQSYIDEKGHLRDILKLKQEIAIADKKKQREETTETLRKTGLNAWNNYNLANSFYNRQLNSKNVFSDSERKQLKELRDAYEKSSGNSGIWASLREIRDYFKAFAANSKKKYARNFTENKIDQFSQGLGNMSTEKLKALQKELMRANKNRKASTSVFVKSVGDYLTGADRETLLTKVSGMVSARERSSKSNSQKTKSELDEDKKKLKQKLDLLTAQEAAGKKGLAIKKKIKAIDEQLLDFDTTGKKDKKTEQERKKTEREEQKRNKAETKSDDETLKLRMENRQAELDLEEETTKKKLKLIDISYDKQKAEIAKKERELAEQNKKAGTKGLNEKGLTDEQQTEIDKANEINEKSRKKQISDAYKAELQSMRDYLKEYGTVQQQKYAIAKEYDEKIAKAEGEAQKKLLERQKQEALSNIVSKDAMMSIDWRETFGNMGSVLQDIAKETLAKVDEYMKSDSFKNLEAKDKKAYAELRSNLRSSVNNDNINVFSTKMWDDISTYAEKYKNSVKALQDATKKHELAIDGLEKAEEELSKATTDEAKEIAKKKVENAKKKVSDTATEVQTQQQNVNNDKEDLDDSAETAAIALQNFQALLSNITSGSLTGFAKGVGQLINGIAGGSTKVGDALQGLGGKIGGLVGAILSIIEALGDDPAGFIDNLFNKIVTAVEGILTNLDKIALSIVKGVGNLTGGIIRATLSGATFGLYNANGNVEEMNKRIEELKAANEELAKSIKDLAESISDTDSTNKDSVEAYKKAVAAQKESNENQQEAIRAEASKYSNSGHGFLGMGGRSSFNVYANDNRSNWLPQFNEALRKSGYNAELNDVSQVWNLTAEQLKAIRSNAPKAWSAFFNSGGEGNPKELVEEYIDSAAGALDELTDKLNEKLTGYSWNGFKQNYESLLSDLESTTEDFGDNISEIINKALVNSFVNSPEMQSRIKNLYNYISDAARDGIFTNKEVGEIRRQNEEIANYSIQWRQAMEEAGIIQKKSSSSSEASGSINTAKGITDDTANELVGRVTAVELTEERLAAGQQQQFIAITQISGNISAMVNQVSGIHNIADETRSILANSYMELQQINENTREVVKPIKLMQSDIAEMKRKL